MPGTMPLVESVMCRRPEADSLGIEQNADRSHCRIVIKQRFTLPPQHHIGLWRELPAVFFQCDKHLAHDFSRREIADQSQLRGQAKVAVHSAAGLRGNANRLATIAGHEHGFDLREFWPAFTRRIADRKEVTDRTVHGSKFPPD